MGEARAGGRAMQAIPPLRVAGPRRGVILAGLLLVLLALESAEAEGQELPFGTGGTGVVGDTTGEPTMNDIIAAMKGFNGGGSTDSGGGGTPVRILGQSAPVDDKLNAEKAKLDKAKQEVSQLKRVKTVKKKLGKKLNAAQQKQQDAKSAMDDATQEVQSLKKMRTSTEPREGKDV